MSVLGPVSSLLPFASHANSSLLTSLPAIPLHRGDSSLLRNGPAERWRILGIFSLSLSMLLGGCKSCRVDQVSPTEAPSTRPSISTTPQPSPPPPGGLRHEKIELEGDPSFGTVYWIPQVHYIQDVETDPAIHKKIILCQYEVLKELERLQLKYIFPEANTSNSPNRRSLEEAHFASLPEPDRLGEARFLEGLVSGPLPKDWDDLRPELKAYMELSKEGNLGAFLYGMRHEDVAFLRTLTPEEHEEFTATLKSLEAETKKNGEESDLRNHPIFQEQILFRRERIATREITQFLTKKAGAKVALVFGRDHEFRDDFQRLPRIPRLISIRLPGSDA